jgi:hypothetical protein
MAPYRIDIVKYQIASGVPDPPIKQECAYRLRIVWDQASSRSLTALERLVGGCKLP